MAALYAGRPDVDLTALVSDLVKDESVPFLAPGATPTADCAPTWLSQTLQELGLTRTDLASWRPPAPTKGRRKAAGTPLEPQV